MRTIDELKKEINDNLDFVKNNKSEPRKNKAILKKNEKLKELLMFLETNPNEDYLRSERKRLSELIKKKEENYVYWSSNVCSKEVDVKKRKSLFNRELGLTQMKNQIKTISYILN